MAAVFLLTKFPPLAIENQQSEEAPGRFGELLRSKPFLFAVFTQFMYVGGQVGTWSYFIQYVQTYAHQTQKLAGIFLTGTLVAFAVGRFSSAWIMQRTSPAQLMLTYSLSNIVLVAVAIAFPGWVGLWAIFITSFFMSIMFPTIFALGLRGLGPNTKIGGSLLVMAIIGGAVLTPIMGLISEYAHSIAASYCVPLAAYVVIALFSLSTRRAERSSLVS
jgi:FHS family L-fucose permease-like MFS transporter